MKIEKPHSKSFHKSKEIDNSYILNYDLHYFVSIDNENKICFDCGGPFPTYVSINNGVFICSNCAKNHEKLGYNISYIHQICTPWDPYLLSYATRGGNSRFKRLCLQYEVPCQSFSQNDEEKLIKYKIRLGEYYRLLLRSEIFAEEPPQPLYHEVARQLCNTNVIIFPEFQNYHLYKGEVIVPGRSYSIGGKIWNGTKATVGVIGTAGEIVYNAGKPVIRFLGGAAYKGAKAIGNSILNHYTGSEGEEKNNTPNNNININNSNGNRILNDFAMVDYSNEDLCQIKTVDLNTYIDKPNMNANYNANINNINVNYNYNNCISKNKITNNNGIFNNQMPNINKHNNIIVNDNYLINNQNIFENINNNTFDNSNNYNNVNTNKKKISDEFEVVSDNQIKDYNNSSNSLFENNSFSRMNVQFENTDKEKAREDANDFLLKP